MLSTKLVDMNNPPFEATPRALKSTSTTTPAGVTQWFALHYADGAEPSLPRTVFANSSSTSSDGGLLRFTLAPTGRAAYVVFEVPVAAVMHCRPHAEIRSALADAFGSSAAA